MHGKQSRKEAAELFAQIAARKGLQTLSFDLSGHGERADAAPLDVFNGTRDLKLAASYAFRRWERVSLYACSIGAYFSLQALTESPFERALFQSPIVDMPWLAGQMMAWFHVTWHLLRKSA